MATIHSTTSFPLKNQKVLVLGLGATGLSLVRYLRLQGAQAIVVDTRVAPPQKAALQALAPEVPCYCGSWPDQLLEQVAWVAVSPGVPLTLPLVQQAQQRGLPVIGDIELFAQALPAGQTMIAITGSNGKTTVTTLVGELCRAAGRSILVAGNIGLPVLDWLCDRLEDQSTPSFWPDVIVLELSSFQLETTSSLAPTAAVVLNLSQDHLDRYNNLADYAAAKARIYQQARYRLIHREDPLVVAMTAAPDGSFGLSCPQKEDEWGLERADDGKPENTWLCQGQQRLCRQQDLRLLGNHNALNVLAALALTRAVGLPYEKTLPAARNFQGLAHRVMPIGRYQDVLYVDDSKGTNVGAVIAALSGWPGKVVLIAGGEAKGQYFSQLIEPVRAQCRAVIVLGVDGPLLAATLAASRIPIFSVVSMEDAVQRAAQEAKPGDTVLLSPGCASFDMFHNYEHRAEVFAQAVRRLMGEIEQTERAETTKIPSILEVGV